MRHPNVCQQIAQQIIDKFHLTPQEMWNLVTRGTKACVTPHHRIDTWLGGEIRAFLEPYTVQLLAEIIVSSDIDLRHYQQIPDASTYGTARKYFIDLACTTLIEKIGQMLQREEMLKPPAREIVHV